MEFWLKANCAMAVLNGAAFIISENPLNGFTALVNIVVALLIAHRMCK